MGPHHVRLRRAWGGVPRLPLDQKLPLLLQGQTPLLQGILGLAQARLLQQGVLLLRPPQMSPLRRQRLLLQPPQQGDQLLQRPLMSFLRRRELLLHQRT